MRGEEAYPTGEHIRTRDRTGTVTDMSSGTLLRSQFCACQRFFLPLAETCTVRHDVVTMWCGVEVMEIGTVSTMGKS